MGRHFFFVLIRVSRNFEKGTIVVPPKDVPHPDDVSHCKTFPFYKIRNLPMTSTVTSHGGEASIAMALSRFIK